MVKDKQVDREKDALTPGVTDLARLKRDLRYQKRMEGIAQISLILLWRFTMVGMQNTRIFVVIPVMAFGVYLFYFMSDFVNSFHGIRCANCRIPAMVESHRTLIPPIEKERGGHFRAINLKLFVCRRCRQSYYEIYYPRMPRDSYSMVNVQFTDDALINFRGEIKRIQMDFDLPLDFGRKYKPFTLTEEQYQEICSRIEAAAAKHNASQNICHIRDMPTLEEQIRAVEEEKKRQEENQ